MLEEQIFRLVSTRLRVIYMEPTCGRKLEHRSKNKSKDTLDGEYNAPAIMVLVLFIVRHQEYRQQKDAKNVLRIHQYMDTLVHVGKEERVVLSTPSGL